MNRVDASFTTSLCVDREDYETGEYFVNETNKEKFYEEIKSGVETGWDFSSRWFITANGTNRG